MDINNSEISPCGDIEIAVKSALPMIDHIALQARSQAQRASTLAMHEYRRKLQGIVLNLQDTVRDEGSKLAEQMRQAVLLQAEEKALDLVDDFIHGRQAEVENLSHNLLLSEESIENATLELDEAPLPAPVNEFPMSQMGNKELQPKTVASPIKQPLEVSAAIDGIDELESGSIETARKPAFDFAAFIACPQT
ncbi:hypothetical protein DGWBC_0368 [Dehalogenimonas sp. WBC-2]|nr:hypothetical protein DGWBC_0368 [Dehalogenimonas sp. WBC-2]